MDDELSQSKIEEVVNAILEEEDKKLHYERPHGINDAIEKRIRNIIKK